MKPRSVVIIISVIASLAMASTALSAIPVESEPTTCPQIVLSALSSVEQLCEPTHRNQACYGHVFLDAQPQPGVTALKFDQAGDIENVADIQTLRLSAMDISRAAWGIALMQLQASLPAEDATQNVTLLLLGDVQLENATSNEATAELALDSSANVNIRVWPSANSVVIGTVSPNDSITATGILASQEWVRVRHPDNGRAGWIASGLVADSAALASLAVVEPSSRHYGPMEAFYFQSATGDALCPEAPHSGLVIQTPEGSGRVTFLINEVDIELGSTIFFQATPGGQMTARVVEGSLIVSSAGVSQAAPAGMEISVPLDENLQPNGPPSTPVPYEMDTVRALPVSLLPRAIEIAPPADQVQDVEEPEEDPEESADEEQSEEVESTGDESEEGETDPDGLPSGLLDNPGLGDSLPPGHGGSPPGQDKKDE